MELLRRRLREQCVAFEFEKSSANAGIASVAIQLAGKILRNAYVICVIVGDVLTIVLTYALAVRF